MVHVGITSLSCLKHGHSTPCPACERTARLLESLVLCGLAIFIAVGVSMAVLAVTGCHAEIGPVIPPNAPYCDGAGLQCPEHTHCAFPGGFHRARCLPGDDDITDPNSWEASRLAADAGAADGGYRDAYVDADAPR